MLWYLAMLSFNVILCVFLVSYNPLNMSLGLLGLSVILYILLSEILNSWMAMSLILIFSGGMMIILLYMTSLTTNMKFSFPWTLGWAWLSVLMYMSSDMGMVWKSMFNSNFTMVYLFHASHSGLISLALMVIFIALVCVVKYAEYFNGSLKKNF